jgi:hypothetical protein
MVVMLSACEHPSHRTGFGQHGRMELPVPPRFFADQISFRAAFAHMDYFSNRNFTVSLGSFNSRARITA